MEWKEAISALSTGTLRTVDTGYSQWKEEGKTRECRFINALGVGFDAFCAVIAPKYKGWPFGIGYTVSILVALKSWISSGATVLESVEWEGAHFFWSNDVHHHWKCPGFWWRLFNQSEGLGF